MFNALSVWKYINTDKTNWAHSSLTRTLFRLKKKNTCQCFHCVRCIIYKCVYPSYKRRQHNPVYVVLDM